MASAGIDAPRGRPTVARLQLAPRRPKRAGRLAHSPRISGGCFAAQQASKFARRFGHGVAGRMINEPSGSPAANRDEVGAAELSTKAPLLPVKAVEGWIDHIEGRKVFGWAWCRSQPDRPVEMEIRFNNRTLATTRADGLRQDLARAGVGDGRHGFQFLLDEPVPPDQKGLISAVVRCGPDGPFAPLVNRTVQQQAKPAQGEDAGAAGQQTRGSSELRAVLSALAATRKTIEDRLGTLAAEFRSAVAAHTASVDAAARSTEEKLERLRASQEALERQLSAMEVFQARFDAAVATLARSEEATPHGRGADRWLTVVVAAIGLISCISLVLGFISVL